MLTLAKTSEEKEVLSICQKDSVEKMKVFLEQHPDHKQILSFELSSAARVYNTRKILHFLEKSQLFSFSEDWLMDYSTVFLHACSAGDLNIVKRLVKQGCEYYVYDSSYFVISFEHSHIEVARFLLEHNSKSFQQADGCVRALYILHNYFGDHFEVIPGFDLDEEYRADMRLVMPMIDLLLEHGYDINLPRPKRKPDWETPLDVLLYWQRFGNTEIQPLIDFMHTRGARTAQELGPQINELPWPQKQTASNPIANKTLWGPPEWRQQVLDTQAAMSEILNKLNEPDFFSPEILIDPDFKAETAQSPTSILELMEKLQQIRKELSRFCALDILHQLQCAKTLAEEVRHKTPTLLKYPYSSSEVFDMMVQIHGKAERVQDLLGHLIRYFQV